MYQVCVTEREEELNKGQEWSDGARPVVLPTSPTAGEVAEGASALAVRPTYMSQGLMTRNNNES